MTQSPQNLLIVDDDARIRTLLKTYFEDEGFDVALAEDGSQMRSRLAERSVDLILMDVMLPGESGISLAREVHRSADVPIIMVTGKDDVVDKVVGLEVGAEDYITKPFHLREVLARVRTVLRRARKLRDAPAVAGGTADGETFRFGPWRLDRTARTLENKSGRPVELTSGEFDLLLLFVQRPNCALSRTELMDLTRGREWSPFERAIDAAVGRLRRKIETDPANPQFIKTVRGVGYIFAAKVAGPEG